jgi:hypothetical protein
MQKIRFAKRVFRDWTNKARRIDAPDAASGLPKSRLLTHFRVMLRSIECAAAAAVMRTMSVRAASATRTNHPLISRTVCGNRRNLSANAKNACPGGLVLFARNRKRNAHLQLDNGSSQMSNVHAFNAPNIVAACAKKRKAHCSFLVNNHKGIIQIVCATIVTESVAASATRKKATRTFLMRYGIWM